MVSPAHVQGSNPRRVRQWPWGDTKSSTPRLLLDMSSAYIFSLGNGDSGPDRDSSTVTTCHNPRYMTLS